MGDPWGGTQGEGEGEEEEEEEYEEAEEIYSHHRAFQLQRY